MLLVARRLLRLCLLLVDCCLPLVVGCWLFAVCCFLRGICCLCFLCVVCLAVFAARCWMLVGVLFLFVGCCLHCLYASFRLLLVMCVCCSIVHVRRVMLLFDVGLGSLFVFGVCLILFVVGVR